MSKSGVVIGIDLGTSKCCVGVVREGKVEILENERGNKTTPSYVAFTATERLIGEDAKEQATLNPTNTVYGAKRLLGRKFEDPAVQELVPIIPYKLKCTRHGKPFLELDYMKQRINLYPEQVSAMMLTKMVDLVKKRFDGGVEEAEAVISVPASFSNAQRQATKDAAAIAGLKVLALINEPTAAAIAYEANRKEEKAKAELIAVVDFGGGKIEVSFVHVGKGAVKVIAVYGCNRIGGLDIDNELVKILINKFEQERNIDLKHNVKAKERLRNACEKLKHTLSLLPEGRVQLDCLVGDVDFEATVTRNEFDQVLEKKIVGSLEKLERRIEWLSVARVLLVGGSTRIPVVQAWIEKAFGSIKLDKTVNPDEAVAHGAAIRAALLGGHCDVPEVNVYDVIPNLVCLSVDNARETLFNRFTSIPNKIVFQLSAMSSKSVLSLFESQSSLNGVGRLALGNYALRGKSLFSIEIDCQIDISGFLVVSLYLNGKKESLDDVILDTLRLLNNEQLSDLLIQEKKFRKDAVDENKRVMALSELEAYCFQQKNDLETLGKQGTLSQNQLHGFEKKIEEAITWVDNNPDASKSILDGTKLELQAVFSSLSRNYKEHSTRSSSVGQYLITAPSGNGVSHERASRWDQSRGGHAPKSRAVSQSARRSRQGLSEDKPVVDDTRSTNGLEASSQDRERDSHRKGESPQRVHKAENQSVNGMYPRKQSPQKSLPKQTPEQYREQYPHKQTSKETSSRLGSPPTQPRGLSPQIQPAGSMALQPQSHNSHHFSNTSLLQPNDQVGLLPLSSTIFKEFTEKKSKLQESNFSPSIKQALLKTEEKLPSGSMVLSSLNQSGPDNKDPVQAVDARASSKTPASGSSSQSSDQNWANSQPSSLPYQAIRAREAQPYIQESTDLVTSLSGVMAGHATTSSNHKNSPSNYLSVKQQLYIPRNDVDRSGPLQSTNVPSTNSSSTTSRPTATEVSIPTPPLELDTSSDHRNTRYKQPEMRSIEVQTDPPNKGENTSRPTTSNTCEVCRQVYRCGCTPANGLRENLGSSVIKGSNGEQKGLASYSLHQRPGSASRTAFTTVPLPRYSSSPPYSEGGSGRPTTNQDQTPAFSLYTDPPTVTTNFAMGSTPYIATPSYHRAFIETRSLTNPTHSSQTPLRNSGGRGNVHVSSMCSHKYRLNDCSRCSAKRSEEIREKVGDRRRWAEAGSNVGAGEACKCGQVSCQKCHTASSIPTARSRVQELTSKFETHF